MSFPIFADLSYLVAAALFIFGLKRLQSPATAQTGNLMAAIGMLIAIVVTLLDRDVVSYEMILVGVVVGSLIGAISARAVQMTAMPQMVAIFNGFGGAASALVAMAEFYRLAGEGVGISIASGISIMVGTLIGAVTFSGSMIAFGKLQGLVTTAPVTYPLQKTFNSLLLVTMLAMAVYLIAFEPNLNVFLAFLGVGLLLGVLSVVPIGGADMPVVISLLNSYSGLGSNTFVRS